MCQFEDACVRSKILMLNLGFYNGSGILLKESQIHMDDLRLLYWAGDPSIGSWTIVQDLWSLCRICFPYERSCISVLYLRSLWVLVRSMILLIPPLHPALVPTGYTALHCTVLHCTVPYCTALHRTTLHCTILHFTALYCTALPLTTLHCTVLYCTALDCTGLLGTTIHCTVLHCILPYCIAP